MSGHPMRSCALAACLALAACEANPSAPAAEEDHDDSLTADLALSANHVHTLSELTFTVTVRDHDGAPVSDLASVSVERLQHETDTWRATELALAGTSWEGVYTFATSGEYDVRVSVLRHGATEPEVVHEMAEHLEVARAHVEIEGMRVEFESFPGHIHEGDTAELKFWVVEPEKNAEGVRPPVPGLQVEIACEEEGGFSEMHAGVEAEPGVYVAEHAFQGAGEFHAGIHLPNAMGQMMETEFHTHVSHGH